MKAYKERLIKHRLWTILGTIFYFLFFAILLACTILRLANVWYLFAQCNYSCKYFSALYCIFTIFFPENIWKYVFDMFGIYLLHASPSFIFYQKLCIILCLRKKIECILLYLSVFFPETIMFDKYLKIYVWYIWYLFT